MLEIFPLVERFFSQRVYLFKYFPCQCCSRFIILALKLKSVDVHTYCRSYSSLRRYFLLG